MPAGQGVVEGGAIPYQPWALAKRQENFANRATLDPETSAAILPGVPRITYMPYPFQIVQQADKVSILYEYLHAIRYVYMNGNPHPEGPIDWWMGDSRGRWEGNTLVVDVDPLQRPDLARPRRELPQRGLARRRTLHADRPRSHAATRSRSKTRRCSRGPWKMSMPLYRRQESNAELLEYDCTTYRLEEEWNQKDSLLFGAE